MFRPVYRSFLSLSLLTLVLWLAVGCERVQPYDYKQLFADTASVVVLPGYRELRAQSSELLKATTAFCKTPETTSLESLRKAWREARGAWKRIQVVHYGPVMDLSLRSHLDWWPSKPNKIQEALDATGTADVKWIGGLGASARGLPAMEWLLFSETKKDDELLKDFQVQQGKPSRRCAVLLAYASAIDDKVEEVLKKWEPAHGNFATELTQTALGSKTFATNQDAINRLVNDLLYLNQKILLTKLGKPLGKSTGGEVQPKLLESYLSENSVADLRNNLAGMKALFSGQWGDKKGESLMSFLRFLGAGEMGQRILKEMEDAETALKALKSPLSKDLAAQKAELEKVYKAFSKLQESFSVDLVGRLGVTVGFSDNDGD